MNANASTRPTKTMVTKRAPEQIQRRRLSQEVMDRLISLIEDDGLTAGDQALSAEAMEVLQDLSAIAQVQNALEESEDGENDYMEVMEYLRVAPLLLFSECAKPVAAAKPSLH